MTFKWKLGDKLKGKAVKCERCGSFWGLLRYDRPVMTAPSSFYNGVCKDCLTDEEKAKRDSQK